MRIFNLQNDKFKVSILDYGAAIHKFIIKDTNTNIVLTNENLSDYKNPKNGYLGLTIGPVTNRISNGIVEVEGKRTTLETDSNNVTLHSGTKGFWNKTFSVLKHDKTSLVFQLISNEEQDGFFGNKELLVRYILLDDGLRIEYELKTDDKTPINITNHSYFNLNGTGDILGHELYINANKYIDVDEKQLPVGFKDLEGSNLDFSKPRLIGNNKNEISIDHHYQFNEEGKVVLRGNDLELTLTTSYPGVQVYSSNNASGQLLDNGEFFTNYKGIALEPQFEIDAMNFGFRDITINKGQVYQHFIEYRVKDYSNFFCVSV